MCEVAGYFFAGVFNLVSILTFGENHEENEDHVLLGPIALSARSNKALSFEPAFVAFLASTNFA